MSMQTAVDIPIQITIPGSSPSAAPLLSAERRISPAWTIGQLRAKLESVTGIPPGAQKLRTKGADNHWITLEPEDSLVGDARWALRRGCEIEITDTRPPAARQNFSDVSSVEKYEMPESQYEQLSDSVLAWKKRQKLGRFDPHAKSATERAEDVSVQDEREIQSRGLVPGVRCRVGGDDARRGVVRFVGAIDGVGGPNEVGCRWVGVEFDEPVGRNNGSVRISAPDEEQQTRRIFECRDKFGVFVRPQKVEVGDWPPLDDLELDEDMEEI